MNLVEWIATKKGSKEALESNITVLDRDVRGLSSDVESYVRIRELFSTIGKSVQDRLIGYFSDLVTSMLQIIYGEEYRFELVFEIKRNKPECSPKLYKGDIVLTDLKYDMGGGILDVISFAMRLAVWSLEKPRTEPTFLLDEPFKYVSVDKLTLVGEALKEIVESLDIQLIMVSHEEELIEIADTAYRVINAKGISEIRREK